MYVSKSVGVHTFRGSHTVCSLLALLLTTREDPAYLLPKARQLEAVHIAVQSTKSDSQNENEHMADFSLGFKVVVTLEL